MNRRGLLFIIIGLVAAIAAGIVVYALSTNVAQNITANAVPTPLPPQGVPVVVAATDINPSTVITAPMLATKQYLPDSVPTGAFSTTTQLLGATTRQQIFVGQPIVAPMFTQAGGRAGASTVITQGKVLTAFPSTDILNSTGAIQPGDHVDILLSIPISGTARIDAGAGTGTQIEGQGRTLVAQATLQDIEVYSTGVWAPGGNQTAAQQQAAAGQKIITFMVDHQEALILKYVKDSGGTIDIVVRSILDNKPIATDPVNIDYLVDLYKFIGLPTNKTP